MHHLKGKRIIWNTALRATYCTFPWLYLYPQGKNKENLSGAEGKDLMVLFHVLTARWDNLHAAHTIDGEKFSSQLPLDVLSFSGDIQSQTMFSQRMANFSITVTHVLMMMGSFFKLLPPPTPPPPSSWVSWLLLFKTCFLEMQLIRVNLWNREQTEGLGSLFNASSQLLSYTDSNDIRLMKVIKTYTEKLK